MTEDDGLADITDQYKWELGFYLVVIAYLLISYRDLLGYSPAARLFPQIVIISTLLLIGIRVFWVYLVGTGYNVNIPFASMSIEGVADSKPSMDDIEGEEPESPEPDIRVRREVSLIAWLVFSIATVYLMGFYAAAFIFPLVYIQSTVQSPKHSLLGASVIFGIIYIMFEFVLSRSLFPGYLPELFL